MNIKDNIRYNFLLRENRWIIAISLLLFILLLFSFPGNRDETDDGFRYALLIRDFSYFEIFKSRYLLFLPINKLLYTATSSLINNLDAYFFMCLLSSCFSVLSLVIIYKILRTELKFNISNSLLGPLFILCSYGFWRYSVEAEVYMISIFSILLYLYLALKWKGNKLSLAHLVATISIAVISILVYKLNAIPIIIIGIGISKPMKSMLIQHFIIGITVLAIYWLVFYSTTEGQTLSDFLFSGPKPAKGFFLMFLPVLGSNFISSNFIYGFDVVNNFISMKFPWKFITEEIFAASNLILTNSLALITVLVLFLETTFISATLIFKINKIRIESPRLLSVLVIWIIIYGGLVLRYDPASPEPWVMLVVPTLLAIIIIITPNLNLLPKGTQWVMLGLLFLSNFWGGYSQISKSSSSYNIYQSDWIINNTTSKDVVVSMGSMSFIKYLHYELEAKVCKPEDGLEETIKVLKGIAQSRGRIFLMEDVFLKNSPVMYRHPQAYEDWQLFLKNPNISVSEVKIDSLRSIWSMEVKDFDALNL